MNKEITEYFQCTCSSEVLQVTTWFSDKEDPETIWLSMFSRGYSGQIGWKFRLRHIWNIIRKGHPYGDEIGLTVEDAKRLSELLGRVSNKKSP